MARFEMLQMFVTSWDFVSDPSPVNLPIVIKKNYWRRKKKVVMMGGVYLYIALWSEGGDMKVFIALKRLTNKVERLRNKGHILRDINIF